MNILHVFRVTSTVVLFAASQSMASSDDMLESAITHSTNFDIDQWKFKVKMLSDYEQSIFEHDPQIEPSGHWKLLEINGQEPTSRQIASRINHEELEMSFSNAAFRELLKSLDPNWATLVEETNTHLKFEIALPQPDPKEGPDLPDLLHFFYVSKDTPHPVITRMETKNIDSFKPQTGIKVDVFKQDSYFEWNDEYGEFLPTGNRVETSGKAFMVKGFDEVIEFQFFAFESAAIFPDK